MGTAQVPNFAAATVNGFKVKTSTTSSTLSSATDSLISESIETNADDINDKKFIAGVDIKVAFSDVAATLDLQVSHNGTDWVTHSTLSADTTPNVTGVKIFIADTSSLQAPYYRLHFNPTGLSVGTSGTLQTFFAVK